MSVLKESQINASTLLNDEEESIEIAEPEQQQQQQHSEWSDPLLVVAPPAVLAFLDEYSSHVDTFVKDSPE